MKTALIILLIILGLILLWFVVAVILEIRRRRRGIEGILVDKAVDIIMTYWDKAPSPRPKNEEESVGEETWKASDIDQEPIVDKEEEDLGLDERFDEVARFVVSEQTASRPVLQRILALGYHRAGCILEQLEEAGIVGPENEGGEREVLIKEKEVLEELLSRLASLPRIKTKAHKAPDDLYWEMMREEELKTAILLR